MGLFVAAISGYHGEKLALATFLTRITFPYLILISLVSLFSGILNSLARFTAAAFAPALLNLAMLSALIFVPRRRPDHRHRAGDRRDRSAACSSSAC